MVDLEGAIKVQGREFNTGSRRRVDLECRWLTGFDVVAKPGMTVLTDEGGLAV